jgi:predicted AAA+ superfamily ATPase
MHLIKRLFSAPNDSFFLFGPRGTGKSTYIHQAYPNALWLDFLNPETERRYRTKPERLYDIAHDFLNETLNKTSNHSVIVIDEVQRVPSILTVVHALIEQKKNFQFILTGSSSRKLKRSGVDLLGGRALNCKMHPFVASELNTEFSLNHALKYGLLPLIYQDPDPLKKLSTYLFLYLREEILMEGLVRNLDDFSRFLEVISFSHGSTLNLANIARECFVKRKTVEGYLSVLEDLLLSFRLPVFTKRAQRQMSDHPKFYLFDAGVFRTIRPTGPLDRVEEIDGMALEGLVAQHLLAWIDYQRDRYQLSFWRTRSGVEVDFILYGSKIFCGIEVKNSKTVCAADTKPLEAFLLDYPMAKGWLLYRGEETFKQGNVICMPCEIFLKKMFDILRNESILV